MIPLIFIAGAAVVGAVVLAAFWKEIREWLGRVWQKLPPTIKQHLQGAKAYLEKIEATVKNVWYFYSYNLENQKWTETIVSKVVDENSIPKDIQEKMQRKQRLEISDEYEAQMQALALTS